MTVTNLFHEDAAGQKNPQSLMGKKFFHLKTSNLYEVTGYRFNASTDQWSIEYRRYEQSKRGQFNFSRDMAEFLDGRFVEAK